MKPVAIGIVYKNKEMKAKTLHDEVFENSTDRIGKVCGKTTSKCQNHVIIYIPYTKAQSVLLFVAYSMYYHETLMFYLPRSYVIYKE